MTELSTIVPDIYNRPKFDLLLKKDIRWRDEYLKVTAEAECTHPLG